MVYYFCGTDSRISSLFQDPLTSFRRQRLRTCYNTFCAMDNTSSTWERDKRGVFIWIDGLGIERQETIQKEIRDEGIRNFKCRFAAPV
jgi:hypothetical protein